VPSAVKALDFFVEPQNVRRIEAQPNDHRFRRTTLKNVE